MWTQDTTELKARILAYVRVNDYVSFVELGRHFADEFEMDGNVVITGTNDPNLILWAGMSDLFAQAMLELLEDNELHPHPSSLFIYMIDGGTLTFPIAKRPPAAGYKSERWLPVTLRTVPL